MKHLIFLASILLLSFSGFSQHNISGQIALYSALPVCDVLVDLKDQNGQLVDQDITGEDGQFIFQNLSTEEEYTLHFTKVENANIGVSVIDIVIASKIILGITQADIDHFWAGDVNVNGSLTTLDLVFIKKAILGIEADFPASSWAFDTQDVYPPDNQVEVGSLTEDLVIDVLGVKRGDLNASAQPCE